MHRSLVNFYHIDVLMVTRTQQDGVIFFLHNFQKIIKNPKLISRNKLCIFWKIINFSIVSRNLTKFWAKAPAQTYRCFSPTVLRNTGEPWAFDFSWILGLIFTKSWCLDYDNCATTWKYDCFFWHSCFDTRVEWIMIYFKPVRCSQINPGTENQRLFFFRK